MELVRWKEHLKTESRSYYEGHLKGTWTGGSGPLLCRDGGSDFYAKL